MTHIRKDYIGFKVSEHENEVIRRKADQVNVNLSVYVRTSALEKEIKVIDGLREMIRELNAIGNNLNQMTVMLRIGNIQSLNLETIKDRFIRFVDLAESTLERK